MLNSIGGEKFGFIVVDPFIQDGFGGVPVFFLDRAWNACRLQSLACILPPSR